MLRTISVGESLFGSYYVKPWPSAIRDAAALFPRYGDYQEARRHALKLAYWPGEQVGSTNQAMDLDWEWIQALRGEGIAELRISGPIGGHRNLRIIFWVADKSLSGDPMTRIWTLAVVAKKAQNWTSPELSAFRGRLTILKKRHGY
ncbi:hypothetical protein [Posidoniimonas corsicana]|uniref:hypothetical protein n=1 Tax=Posidoniimonas corsicana TaxID=1938618 RepID=UPI0011B62A52|nr:hypothetical protein [Posidoniimonas corsicana]